MIIEEKYGNGKGTQHNVYAIYWIDNQTNFLIFSSCSYGANAYGLEEINIIDPDLSDDFVFESREGGFTGIIHKALLENDLLDDLIDHDEDAYNEFVKCLGHKP